MKPFICCNGGRMKGDALQCCSVSKSAFTFGGSVIAGPAGASLKRFTVEQKGDTLQIFFN